MIEVRSIEEANEKRVRQSLRAYFEGLQGLMWILGVIDSEEALALQLLRARFQNLVGTPPYEQLKANLEARLSSRASAQGGGMCAT